MMRSPMRGVMSLAVRSVMGNVRNDGGEGPIPPIPPALQPDWDDPSGKVTFGFVAGITTTSDPGIFVMAGAVLGDGELLLPAPNGYELPNSFIGTVSPGGPFAVNGGVAIDGLDLINWAGGAVTVYNASGEEMASGVSDYAGGGLLEFFIEEASFVGFTVGNTYYVTLTKP